jgi:subtilase family serine protease
VSLPVRALNPQRLTVVADYDGSIRENDEFDNEASADYAPVNATAGTRPDLSVSDISVAVDELTDGQPTVVFVTVDNTGNATSAGKVDVALCCTDGSRSQASLNGLLPGGSAVLGFPWTASGWTQTAGNVTFNATVNFRRSSTEWSFDGNELLRTFRVHMPDYNISRLVRWNTTEGLEAPMFAIVDNLGIGDSVRPATLDVFIGGKLHSEHSFSGLRAGERLTVPLGWQAESGYQDIRIEVDRHSQVQESDEANNVYFDQVYTDYPELSVACITWAPHPDNGSVLTVFAEVHNTGTGATGRPFQFSHSADSADAETTTLFGLAANSSTIVSWKWALQPGEHVFTATADSNGAVREPNENDNRLMVDYPSGRARPIPPFLNIVVENITYRQSANRTGDISQNILTLVVSVQNDGQQDLPGSFLAIIADSILVVELNVPALAVNASAVLAYPWNATVANHTILVAADFRDQFPEDIETDNEKAILIEANDPPMAYAGGLRKATAGDPVKFRGSFGKDNDGYIALYEWDFDGDGKYDYSSAVSAEADHVYYKNGTYIARLRVTDDRGATSESTAAVKVRLEEARPLIRMDELTYAAMIASLTVLAMAAVLIYRKRDNG